MTTEEVPTSSGSSEDTSRYEELRLQHISDLLARMPENIRRVKWPAERIREERQQRLRSLIRVAKEKSPWHRERLNNFDEIITDKRLSLEMVNAHVASLREDKYLLDQYHVIASGGTSGFRGVFVYDWDAWTTCALALRHAFLPVNPLLWRLLSFRPIGRIFANSRTKKKKARRPQSKAASVLVFADIASHMSHAIANSVGYPFIDQEYPATLSIQEIVEGLNSAQPDSLSAYPSILYQLALEAKAGRLHIMPRRIASGAEPLLPHIRNALRDTWGIPVTNFWITSEGGCMSWSCGKGEGMHLNEDLQIVEAVDENGRPISPGIKSSKIYLTNLFK